MKTKVSILIYSLILSFVLIGSCKKDEEDDNPAPVPVSTVTDIDGNVYHTVTIGAQTWMVENLKVTRFRNGDPIPNITDETEWSNMVSSARCNYNNDSAKGQVYGRLYNWYAVTDSRYICPSGWHIPSQAEWTTLVNYLGGVTIAGGKLKETGTVHWLSPNTGATNSAGFNGLPAGTRNNSGSFSNEKNHGYWWTSDENDADNAWEWNVNYNHSDIYNYYDVKSTGFSIRCVKD